MMYTGCCRGLPQFLASEYVSVSNHPLLSRKLQVGSLGYIGPPENVLDLPETPKLETLSQLRP